jgi:pyruvate kinase
MISRFKPPVWVVAISASPGVCQGLQVSYGVHPVQMASEPTSWRDFAAGWLREQQISGDIAMLVAGPSDRNPDASHRIEFMRIREGPAAGAT